MKRLLNHYQKEVMMNKIERLLQQHCPNGVEWKMLGKVAEITRGQRVTKLQLIPDGKFPVISGGIKPLGYLNNCNRETNTITIAQYGTAGYVNFITEPFWANDVCYCIFPTKVIQNKYLYYYLINKQEFIYSLNTNAIPAHLPQDKLTNIPIPLPPLAVQEEIVRILDTFTTLETELEIALEAELECCKKQYDYYRNKLLTFKQNEVEWKTLGEITFNCKSIKWKETNKTYQYIDLTSVSRKNNTIIETTNINAKTAPNRAQKIIEKDDIIFATTRPTQIRLALINDEYDGQIASSGYCVLKANKRVVLPKWIYFCLTTSLFKDYLERYQSGSAYPAISDSKLKEYKIPLPSLSEQKRIADILDKFDTLTASISEGLPKEIALRKKQYEYYREKLLSFPKVKEKTL